MSRAALFLGSGISYASGAPSVGTITNKVLNGAWQPHTDWRFYPRRASDGQVSVGVAQRAQDSLRRLKREIDPHLLAREKHDANYQDLYAAARQILDDEIGEVTNPLLADVLEKIKAASADLHVGGDHTTLYTNTGQDYGSSVVATLKGAKPARHAGVPYFAAVRHGDLKYIRYLASGEPEELYDLGADPRS
jgi:hypothetical protein